MSRATLALALAIIATPAAADPLTELLNRIFRPAPAATVKDPLTVRRERPAPAQRAPVGAARWISSYYGGGERLNAFTANGEPFRADGFTAAHRTLPMGTRLHVCLRGCAVVRVNDRGPAAWTGRNLDLARGAAERIGLVGPGVARVSVTILN